MLRQLFHIRRPGNLDQSMQVLSIQVGERHCSYAISNQQADQLYELGYYAVDPFASNPVDELLHQQEHLKERFYQVLVGYDHPQSVLTPGLYYRPDDAGMLLKTLYGVNGTANIISEQVGDWQLHNLYAVPGDLHEWVRRQFISGKFWHQYSIGLKNHDRAAAGMYLLVDFRTDDFSVIAIRDSQLLLAQTFVYSTPEDVLYQLLRICEQFELSQQVVNLQLSGLIDQGSVLFKELFQYFIHVEFRNARWDVPDNEYPAHFFTTLNDLARCAS